MVNPELIIDVKQSYEVPSWLLFLFVLSLFALGVVVGALLHENRPLDRQEKMAAYAASSFACETYSAGTLELRGLRKNER